MESWQLGLAAFVFTVVSNFVTWAITHGRKEGTTGGQIRHIEAMLTEREKDIARIEKTVEKLYESRYDIRDELQEHQKAYWFEVKSIVEGLRAEIKRLDSSICNACRHKP